MVGLLPTSMAAAHALQLHTPPVCALKPNMGHNEVLLGPRPIDAMAASPRERFLGRAQIGAPCGLPDGPYPSGAKFFLPLFLFGFGFLDVLWKKFAILSDCFFISLPNFDLIDFYGHVYFGIGLAGWNNNHSFILPVICFLYFLTNTNICKLWSPN